MERFEAHARAMEKLMPWINEASQAHKDSLDGNELIFNSILIILNNNRFQ
jgi:hypothetical protein